jgi:hypothetical protein
MSQSSASLTKAKRPSMSAFSIAEQTKIDSSLARFSKEIPDHPYILSVPNFDLPHKRPHELALEESRWIRDSPFTPDEAHLQYMTFLLRDTSDSCFELRTQVDEEREQRMRERERNGTTATEVGVGTSKVGPAKKKISLAAYKQKKEKGYVSDSKPSPESEKLSPPDTTEAVIAPARQTNGHVTKDRSKAPTTTQTRNASRAEEAISPRNTTNMKKRKSPELDDVVAATVQAQPTKKSRPNTPVPLTKDVDTTKSSSNLKNINSKASHGLPPLLSPGKSNRMHIPPLHSPPAINSNQWLPPLLSPTIDPELEEDLRRKMKERVRADSDVSSLSDPHSSKYPTPSKPEKAEPSNTASNELRKAQQVSEKLNSVESKHVTHHLATVKALSDKKVSEKRSILKLKYGRKLRKDVENILKRPPKRPRPVLGPAFTEQSSSQVTKAPPREDNFADRKASPGRESNSITPFTGKKVQNATDTAESSKRRLPESTLPEKPAKKLKPLALTNGTSRTGPDRIDDLPVTPVQDEFDTRKTHNLVTPKDASAASMARSASNNSHMTTPQNLTPLPPARAASSSHMSKSTSSNSSGERGLRASQLTQWSMKFNNAGRDLKHRAQKIKVSSGNPTSEARKQQAIIYLESIMTYMIAYTYQDHVNHVKGLPATYKGTWHTLGPYVNDIRACTKHFPDLEALRNYLAYAMSQRAISNMLSYLVASTSSPPASTPVASGAEQHHSPESTNSAQPPPVDTGLPGRLSYHYHHARGQMAEAITNLNLDDIAKRYPQTWAAREQKLPFDPNASKKEREDMLAIVAAGELGAKLLNGPFWLPATDSTTPAQAVRFGVSLCTEWMKKESVKYEIGLTKIQ